MLAIALAGCGDNPKRLNLTTQALSTDLTLTTYERRNPSEGANTTVYELRRLRGDHSFIVSMIYADSHGRLISLAATPVTTDNISCDPGIFQIGWVPDVPLPELHLFVDRRGNLSSKTVESHYTKEASALRTRNTEAVLVVDSIPLEDRHMQRRMELAPPGIVTITTQQGAPVSKLLELVNQFADQTHDIRLAMLPWDWANPPGLTDETGGAPTKPSTATNQPALRTD
jgi:hypothetical protein